MPDTIHGKTVSQKGHRMWRHVYESMLSRGSDKGSAAAAATSQVKKDMAAGTKKKASAVLLNLYLMRLFRT